MGWLTRVTQDVCVIGLWCQRKNSQTVNAIITLHHSTCFQCSKACLSSIINMYAKEKLCTAWFQLLSTIKNFFFFKNQMNKPTLCLFQTGTDALCIQRNLLVHHCRLQVLLYQSWKPKKQRWLQSLKHKNLSRWKLIWYNHRNTE